MQGRTCFTNRLRRSEESQSPERWFVRTRSGTGAAIATVTRALATATGEAVVILVSERAASAGPLVGGPLVERRARAGRSVVDDLRDPLL